MLSAVQLITFFNNLFFQEKSSDADTAQSISDLTSKATQGGAGSPSHNALRMKYIINCRLSRDLLVVSGVRGVHLG